jgi:carboxyl-terminal processing protease
MGRREYVGIGVVPVTRQGHHYVWHVRPDSPADQAGLKAFDRLLAVDGHTVDAFPDEEVGRRIQGPAGTIVTLTMRRRGEPQPRLVPVVRGVVPVQAVEHRVLPPGIGYVRLADFAGGTGRAMRRALEDLQSRGLDGLIVDVRNNPGGFFREVAQVAELLLPRGSMVEALETRFGRSVHVTRDDPLLSASIPLVILVNERTQSAAETFAAAVQGAGRGVLIGTRTAGDAGSKTLVWLPDGAGLLMRKARVISPRGADLDKDGVAPDVIQELTLEELDRGLDSQLLRASAAVRQK